LAIAEYTDAILGDRGYADAFYARSLAYRSLGDIEKADADLAQSGRLKANPAAARTPTLENIPQDAVAAYDRGQSYYKLRNYNSAIAEYTHAIQLKPDYADAFYARSLAFRSSGDIEKADADLAETGRLRAAESH
jgi:tetratricopeptide (TPR) repeat protein